MFDANNPEHVLDAYEKMFDGYYKVNENLEAFQAYCFEFEQSINELFEQTKTIEAEMESLKAEWLNAGWWRRGGIEERFNYLNRNSLYVTLKRRFNSYLEERAAKRKLDLDRAERDNNRAKGLELLANIQKFSA